MKFEVIDFHTHPFIESKDNICSHKDFFDMSADITAEVYRQLEISKICGSVICGKREDDANAWQKIKRCNNEAVKLKKLYGDFYVPGFHIHPDFIDESIAQMDWMVENGFSLIGELVPYCDGWDNYSSSEFSCLLDEAGKRNLVVNFHSQGEDEMDKMVQNHPDVVFVAAHPGEYRALMRHIERMKQSENYYVDLSGTGMFRYGMLRRIIDTVGVDRIIFGSDYPTCAPAMFLGGILLDNTLTDTEKEKILSINAKKLLKL